MEYPVRPRLSVDEFYAWVSGQDRKYELVDGEPVMMAGANRRHDRIASNSIRVIGTKLQGHRCQPFTSDTFIRIPAGNRRQADTGIDCGPFDDESLEAAEPVFVMEIPSPTTRTFDRANKLEEYRTVPTLEYVLLVDPDFPQVRLYRRDAGRSWSSTRLSGLETVVDLPVAGVSFTLQELYSGLTFRPRPGLVESPDAPASRSTI